MTNAYLILPGLILGVILYQTVFVALLFLKRLTMLIPLNFENISRFFMFILIIGILALIG